MPKIFKDENVLTAAQKRYEIIFNNFSNIYLSISGGKDSSVMFQLAASEARKQRRKFDVLYIDLEAQYSATIEHVENLFKNNIDVLGTVYWICLPISLRNAVSILQPKWICWGKEDKEKWVREMPENKHVVNINNCPFDWFKIGMEFEEFIVLFAQWYSMKYGMAAAGIGIRSDESLNRFRTIISETKETFNDYGWTTRVRLKQKPLNCYNFFPLYDWRTSDIWTAVSKLNLEFNEIYELMYKNGLSIHEQRLCQPYGDDQRNGLDQFRSLEPDTWEKVLNRVNGVNFGNIYCRTSLLGNLKSEKPRNMSWQQYAVYLLESIGIFSPELEEHYRRKIKTFLAWWDKEGIPVSEIRDENDKKLESSADAPSWRRIARAIEKNDFWMKRLSFSATKYDVQKLNDLKLKYKNILGDGKVDKDLKRWDDGKLFKEVENG